MRLSLLVFFLVMLCLHGERITLSPIEMSNRRFGRFDSKWDIPSHITCEGPDAHISSTVYAHSKSQMLFAAVPRLNISTGSTITGISISFFGKSTSRNLHVDAVHETQIMIAKNNDFRVHQASIPRIDTLQSWGTSERLISYPQGQEDSLWNETWKVTDFNTDGVSLGLVVSAAMVDRTVHVRCITVTITYIPPAPTVPNVDPTISQTSSSSSTTIPPSSSTSRDTPSSSSTSRESTHTREQPSTSSTSSTPPSSTSRDTPPVSSSSSSSTPQESTQTREQPSSETHSSSEESTNQQQQQTQSNTIDNIENISSTSEEPATPKVHKKATNSSAIAFGIIFFCYVVMTVFGAIVYIYRVRRARMRKLIHPSETIELQPTHPTLRDVTIGEVIFSGHSASVYEAVYNSETVACKVPTNKSLANNYGALKREYNILHPLNHSNLVKVLGMAYATIDKEERHVMVLALEARDNLEVYVKDRHSSISQIEILRWIMGIARGLGYLHARHILHRDIAARNILLSEYDYTTPKICDFERAVVETFNEQDDEWNYYDFQNTAVPVQWTAPEVVRTISPLKSTCYTQKTDIYSFGILICELLNRGFPPYEKFDHKKTTEKNYTYPRILSDTQMVEVSSIAMGCLTFRPTLRTSAEEIANESIRIISKMTPRLRPDDVSSGSSTYVDLYH